MNKLGHGPIVEERRKYDKAAGIKENQCNLPCAVNEEGRSDE